MRMILNNDGIEILLASDILVHPFLSIDMEKEGDITGDLY